MRCSQLAAVLASLLLWTVSASTKVATKNAKQAAQIQAASVRLAPGHYVLTNKATGKSITYQSSGNRIFPAKGKGSAAAVSMHSKQNWIRLNFGVKLKCLSSAFVGHANTMGVAYACITGKEKGRTLEPTKQYWIALPVNSHLSGGGTSNAALISAQRQSVVTRKNAHGQHHRMSRVRRALEKTVGLAKRSRTVSSGTYYFIPTDHLIDMPARALTANTISTKGIVGTRIDPWKKASNQQWTIRRV